MNTTTTYTVEIDTDDFRVCENCERTFYEDDTYTDESGTVCNDCHSEWQHAEMVAAMASYASRPITREELMDDQAGFLPGDDEYEKLAGALLNY